MKTICIDARLWGISHTGIGRYTQNLIANLPSASGFRVVLVVAPECRDEPSLATYPKMVARFHPYSPLAQLEMLFIFIKIRPDLVHFTHSAITALWPGKYVVTIHDFIKHQSKGVGTTTQTPLMYWINYLGFLFVNWMSLARAKHIFVPSNYWKNYIHKKYNIPPAKVSVTYEAVSDTFKYLQPSAYNPRIPKPFVVHTGSLYPHKNIPVLVSAVEKLGGKVHLALVCARSVFSSRIPHSPYIHFLGRLSDADLKAVYKKALAYVFPSLIEGFGLPGLEAMAAGVPVIAAEASCLLEIYEDAALYFDPHNPTDLAGKIDLILADVQLRQELIARGKSQARKYSWVKMAQQTWQTYQGKLL